MTTTQTTGALSALMTRLCLGKVSVRYAGSGDSGEYEPAEVEEPDDAGLSSEEAQTLTELTHNLLEALVNPDFNDTGSYGVATFTLSKKKGKIKFHCDHSDVIETSDDTTIDKLL